MHAAGGPEVLVCEEVEVPDPGPGEVLLRQTAIGLNYIDISGRTAAHPPEAFPVILGREAAGVVEQVADGVTRVAPGDRVSHCMVLGSYAEHRVIAADRLIKLPDAISDEVAAAATLKGLTVQYLTRSSYRIEPGDTVLVQAAAGGVGLILCQWAKHLGATVIGTVGTDEKAAYAAAHGCDHPIVYSREDFVARVNEITGGAGVNAVYDAVGKDTFDGGLDCLADCGTLVIYGQSSGPLPPFDLRRLGPKALTIARGALGVFASTSERFEPRAAELFDVIASGAVRIEINQRYPLAEAATAHADLEGRRTMGSSILYL